MRILHTADIHLGHSLNGWSRDVEHRIWFDRLADVIEAEEIDVLMIAGDVFDGLNPSGECQKLLYDSMVEFRRRRPTLTTVMTAGNHDPAHRLEAPGALLAGIDAHVLGTVKRKADAIDMRRHMIPLRASCGTVKAWAVAIPFLRPADLPGLAMADKDGEGSPIIRAAAEFHERFADAARAEAGDLPLIAMGHLHCAGAQESEGAERRIPIGGEHAVPVSVFPECFSYVALGHLHGPQNLDNGRVRYSGSCFPLSVSEIGHRHGVTILEVDGADIRHRHVEIERPAAFHRLPQRGALDPSLLADAVAGLDLDPDLPRDLQPFIHVTLEATGPAGVVLSEAEACLAGLPVRVGGIRVIRAEVAAQAQEDAGMPRTLAEINPEELFLAAFRKTNMSDAEDRHVLAFREAMNGSD